MIRKGFRVLVRVFLGVLAAVLLTLAILAALWLFRRVDPISFLSDQYVAYVQVPSLRGLYDQWLNLEAADAVLGRPELAPYRRALTDLRGLTLTKSLVVRTLLEVPADVMLFKDNTFVAAIDLGWRGMFTPIARIAGPLLRIKGFSFISEAGVPMYRFASGSSTILAALVNNVALVSLDGEALNQARLRHSTRAGLAMKVSREVLNHIKLRSRSAIRVMVDTPALTAELFTAGSFGAKVLRDIKMPDKSMLEVEVTGDTLRLAVRLPITVARRELAFVLGSIPAPMSVLRLVPSNASLLSVSSIAPPESLYQLAAAFQGKEVKDAFAKADSDIRVLVGAGIDQLLYSWVGTEVGAFWLSGSAEAVFFARIANQAAYNTAIEKLTKGRVAGQGSTLVLDGVRVDRISMPWYAKLITALKGEDMTPEPYFIALGGYLFLSLDAANLSTLVRATEKGGTLAGVDRYTALTRGMQANASLFMWYDAEQATPFFMQGAGALADVLRLYASGAVSVHASLSEIRLDLVAQRGKSGGVDLMHGFPVAPNGALTGSLAAFRFKGSGSAALAWIADRSVLVLADAGGLQVAKAKLERDSVLVPEVMADGLAAGLWAISPGGTVHRFGPTLEPQPPFPIATGITGSMPPGLLEGKLALFSRSDSSLKQFGADGPLGSPRARVDGALFMLPDAYDGMLAYSPKGFDAKVHLVEADGKEASGWPVQASGISFGAPRFLKRPGSVVVTFLTQAGTLHAWDTAGDPLPGFPVSLPGVYYATPEPVLVGGQPALVAVAQDGAMTLVGMDGTVLRRERVPNLDGKSARALVTDFNGDGNEEILLYGSGAFIAGYDAAFRPLPGFPIKGVTMPQIVDIDQDGRLDLVTAGLDGKIYAYSVGEGKP